MTTMSHTTTCCSNVRNIGIMKLIKWMTFLKKMTNKRALPVAKLVYLRNVMTRSSLGVT